MAFAGTQQKCKACEKTVYLVEQLTADGVIYHKSCFRCNHCKGTLKVRPALVSASVSLSLFLFLSYFCVFCYVMCCCCVVVVVVVVSSVRSGSRTQWQSFCIVESLLHPLVANTIVNGSRQRFRSLWFSLSLSCCCCSSLQQPGLRRAFHCWEKGQNQHTTEQGPDGLLLPENQTL
jgi:hypothetical protein